MTNSSNIYNNGKNAGIGTNVPNALLGFPAVLGKKITFYPGSNGDAGFVVTGNRLQVYSDNPNADIGFGFDAAGTFNEWFAIKPAGALALTGNTGIAGQVIQSNGNSGASYDFPVKTFQWGLPGLSGFSSTSETNILNQSFKTTSNSTLVIPVEILISVYCPLFGCPDANGNAYVYIDGESVAYLFINTEGDSHSSNTLSNLMVNVGAGDHTIQVNIDKSNGSSNFDLFPDSGSYTSMKVISR